MVHSTPPAPPPFIEPADSKRPTKRAPLPSSDPPSLGTALVVPRAPRVPSISEDDDTEDGWEVPGD